MAHQLFTAIDPEYDIWTLAELNLAYVPQFSPTCDTLLTLVSQAQKVWEKVPE